MSTEILLPKLNSNDEKAKLTSWIVKPGHQVTKGQIIATLETTKTSFDVEASVTGWLYSHLAVGDHVNFGELVGYISDSETPPNAESQEKKFRVERKISKKARDLIAIHKIPLDLISSTSEIILEKDVLEYLNGNAKNISEASESAIDEVILERIKVVRETLDSLRREMKRKFKRHIPIGKRLELW